MNEKKRVSPALAKADKTIFKISKWISYAGGVAVCAIMLIAVIDVILAKFFKSALPSATEWITYLNVLIVFPPLAYVQLERGHTNVELFNRTFPPLVLKIIRICSLILAAAVMVFLAWLGFKMTVAKFISGESSSSDAFAVLAFKIWIFGAVYTVGCGLCALSFLWSLVREFAGLSILDHTKPAEDSSEAVVYENGGEF